MKQEERSRILQTVMEEIKSTISQEEYQKLEKMEEYHKRMYIYRYYKTHHPNAGQNTIKESYDMEGVTALFTRQLSTSAFAHNTLLYVQTAAHLKLPCTHYTTREGMESYMILETVSGSGIVEIQGKRQQVVTGDIVFINCRKWHHYEAGENGWEYRVVHCSGHIMANLCEKLEKQKIFWFPGETCREVHDCISQLMENSGEESFQQELICNNLLTQIITALLLNCPEEHEEIPRWISEICEYLDIHFQANILDDLEKKFFRSKYYISHAFKKYMGISIMQYQINSRLRTAQNLLGATKLPLAEVAILTGYENLNSFDKAFRKKYGISPGAYRRNQGTSYSAIFSEFI